jgi:hypothetical protein
MEILAALLFLTQLGQLIQPIKLSHPSHPPSKERQSPRHRQTTDNHPQRISLDQAARAPSLIIHPCCGLVTGSSNGGVGPVVGGAPLPVHLPEVGGRLAATHL